MTPKIAAVLAIALAVSACSIFEDEEEERLPGTRISVLLHERSINADPELADQTFLLPAPVVNRDWPQAGGYPNHAMHHLALSDTPTRIWSTNIGAGADDEQRFVSTPVVAAGNLFALDTDNELSAYDTETGKRRWSRDLSNERDGDDEHIPGGIAHYRGRLFVTTGFGDVVAVDATSGEEIWRVSVQSPIRSAPTVRGGRVFVVTLDSRVIALDGATGEQIWRHEGIVEVASLLGGASPAIEGNLVIAPYPSGELVALDLESGRMIWTDSLSAIRRTDTVSTLSQIRGHPVVDRGLVLAISHGGLMTATDLLSGQRIWEREIGGIGQPWVAGDIVYVLTNDSEVVALRRETGQIYWVIGLPLYEDPEDKEDPIVWSGPVLAGNRLIVTGSHGEAWAVSPYSGNILGKIELPDGVAVPPIVAAGTVYFLANNADIVAYR